MLDERSSNIDNSTSFVLEVGVILVLNEERISTEIVLVSLFINNEDSKLYADMADATDVLESVEMLVSMPTESFSKELDVSELATISEIKSFMETKSIDAVPEAAMIFVISRNAVLRSIILELEMAMMLDAMLTRTERSILLVSEIAVELVSNLISKGTSISDVLELAVMLEINSTKPIIDSPASDVLEATLILVKRSFKECRSILLVSEATMMLDRRSVST